MEILGSQHWKLNQQVPLPQEARPSTLGAGSVLCRAGLWRGLRHRPRTLQRGRALCSPQMRSQMLRGTQSSSPLGGSSSLLSSFTNRKTGSEDAKASPGPKSHFSSRLKKNDLCLRNFHLLSSMGLHRRDRTSPQRRSWGQEPAQVSGGEKQAFCVLAPNCRASPWSPHHLLTLCFGHEEEADSQIMRLRAPPSQCISGGELNLLCLLLISPTTQLLQKGRWVSHRPQ